MDPQRSAYDTTSVEVVKRFFVSRPERVITFAGFGELGYEHDDVVQHIVKAILGDYEPGEAMANSGTLLRQGGEDGIARMYTVARRLGFSTAGIHPGVALDFATTHMVSPDEEHVFFVEDSSWGGFLDDGRTPSPTLRTLLEVSDELVVIGGGKHAADELAAFHAVGKDLRYFPAEMNRAATQTWASHAGVEIADYWGAAHAVWLELETPND